MKTVVLVFIGAFCKLFTIMCTDRQICYICYTIYMNFVYMSNDCGYVLTN